MDIKIRKFRFWIGILAVFISIVLVFLIFELIFPLISEVITFAYGICIVIFFLHRWRFNPYLVESIKFDIRQLTAFSSLTPLLGETSYQYHEWSLEPETLNLILNKINSSNPNVVVECGSGISTIAIGEILKQKNGGHLFSIEEDPSWYELVNSNIRRKNLAGFITLIHAPITGIKVDDSEFEWYDTQRIAEVISEGTLIDLLLIDGPVYRENISRLPSLYFFKPYLRKDSWILLDDTARDSERNALSRWKEEFLIDVEEIHTTKKGQAIIQFST